MTVRELNARLRNATTFADVRALLAAKNDARRRLVIIDSGVEPTDFLCDRCGSMDGDLRETWGSRCVHYEAESVSYMRSDRAEPESAAVRTLWVLMEFA